MPGFSSLTLMGNSPTPYADAWFANLGSNQGTTTGTPPGPLGVMIEAWDQYWGYAELVLAQFTTASTAVNPGRLVTLSATNVIVDVANTGNTGAPLYMVVSRFPSDATVSATNPLYGWVMRSGVGLAQYAVAATTGSVYVGAAGQATPTAAAGKQILNATCLTAATGTITKTCQTQLVNPLELYVPNKDGLWVGLAVTGTGIAASSTIASLDTGKTNTILLNNSMTAVGTTTITFTYTNFGLVRLANPFVQGQIT